MHEGLVGDFRDGVEVWVEEAVDGSWGNCNGIRDKDGDDAGADFVYRGSLYCCSVVNLVCVVGQTVANGRRGRWR